MNGLCLGAIRQRTCTTASSARQNSKGRRHAGAVRLAALGVLSAASCQSYHPRPLDPGAHQAAWHARTPDVESLRGFLERLELDVREQAEELDVADGVELHEGQLIALAFNPGLRVARSGVKREVAVARHADLWSDPQLSFNVLRIAEDVPDPWLISPGLAFSVPLSGRLGVERDLAATEVVAARAAALEAEWSVWYQVEREWIHWSAAHLRCQETRQAVESMDALAQTVSALAERGEMLRTEAALFRVEQAQRQNLLRAFEGEAASLEQRLRSLLGLAPDCPVDFVPARMGTSSHAPRPGHLPSALETRNPRLVRLRKQFDVSEEALRREIRRQYPDLTIGPLFESEGGQSRLGLSGSLPLPLLNRNRRAIAEARAQREVARAAFESEYEILVGRHAEASARLTALTDRRSNMERTLVPLVDEQLADALELMRLGEGTGLLLLECLVRTNQTKLDLIEARSAEAIALAQIAYLTGPADVREFSEAAEK